MKAIKRTLKIKIEVLSMDSIPALVQDMMKVFSAQGLEYFNGTLISDDGDAIEWITEQKEVEF